MNTNTKNFFVSASRSKNMAAIQSSGTGIEKIVQSAVASLATDYECNVTELPGKPDLYVEAHSAVILVNGCYWHGHECDLFQIPATRKEFWIKKLSRNAQRDAENIEKLLRQGLRVLTVWECAIKGKRKLSQLNLSERIEEFLCNDIKLAKIDSYGYSLFNDIAECQTKLLFNETKKRPGIPGRIRL